jgi:serine/threonine-protein kinase
MLEKFAIAKRLSKNAFYTVYDAADQETGQSVGLKLINKRFSDNSNYVLEIFKINKIMSLIDSAYFLKVYDFGKDGNYYYLAMEPIDTNRMFSLTEATISIPISKFIDISLNIANALRDAHLHGVVHGFLNPNCIYLSSEGSVTIDDFGFFVLLPNLLEQKEPLDDKLVNFVAPEIINGMTDIDGRADIYSLGMILYQLMSGNLLGFDDRFLSAQDQQALISTAENLFFKSLHNIPYARFQNLREFSEELEIIYHQLIGRPSEVKVVSGEDLNYLPVVKVEHVFS